VASGVDPAPRSRPFAQSKDFDTLLGQLDRCPQATTTGADHQDGSGDLLFGDTHLALPRLRAYSLTRTDHDRVL